MAIRDLTNRRGQVAAFLLGFTVLLIAACGGDSDSGGGGSGDENEITSLVSSFFDATVKGKNTEKAYDLLDTKSKAACTKAEFVEQAEIAKEFFEAIGDKVEVKRVYDIKVTGDTATARIDVQVDGESSDQEGDGASFTREGGKWKIAEGC